MQQQSLLLVNNVNFKVHFLNYIYKWTRTLHIEKNTKLWKKDIFIFVSWKKKGKEKKICICLFFKSQGCSKISIGNTKSSILRKLTTLYNLKILSTKNFDTIAKITPIWAMDSKSSCINIENRESQRIFKNSSMLLRFCLFWWIS